MAGGDGAAARRSLFSLSKSTESGSEYSSENERRKGGGKARSSTLTAHGVLGTTAFLGLFFEHDQSGG